LSGGILGLLIGGFIAWAQQTYGLISLGRAGSFVVDAYPVQIHALDFILVFAIVISTSLFSVIYPLVQLARKIGSTPKKSSAAISA